MPGTGQEPEGKAGRPKPPWNLHGKQSQRAILTCIYLVLTVLELFFFFFYFIMQNVILKALLLGEVIPVT